MIVPDDAAEARVMRIGHPDDTAKRRLPKNGSAGVQAQLTGMNVATHAISLRLSGKDYTEVEISQAAAAKVRAISRSTGKNGENQRSTRSIPPVLALPT
jgi:hypothetical protein